jgi:predicted MFS family arabinose efflux permease
VTVSFIACAFPLSLAWFFVWRLISGVGGGAIMVVVAATVLPHIPLHRRGAASGALFLGVGLGIAASGTLVPLLLTYGLRTTWLGLAIVSGVLTTATWSCWPTHAAAPTAVSQAAVQSRQLASGAVAVLYAEYALMAIGLVPAMVFLVDFVTRGSGAGSQRGTLLWILYGIGSILGPPLYGQLADRVGARMTVRALLTLQAIAVVALSGSTDVIVLGVLSVIIGSFPPGIVPMVLAWIRELHPGDQQQQDRIWSRATIDFAACQALAAYAFSAVFAFSGGSYQLIFLLGAGSLAIAVLLDLMGNPQRAV